MAVKGANILVLGITFKENCPDVRNTRVVDIIAELNTYEANLTVYDPWANPAEVHHEYGVTTTNELPEKGNYNAVVLAVAHKEFMGNNWKEWLSEGGIIYDVKSCLDKNEVSARL